MRIKDLIITLGSYVRQPQKRNLIHFARQFKGLKGIEIGGPSGFFGLRGGLPIYIFADQVDGVNFSTETIWEGSIQQGKTYRYHSGKTGLQYITEATDLTGIPDGAYDFVLSCHSLEHVANPLVALREWHRVLKKRGMMVLVLPDKRNTFDEKRPYTEFSHLVADLERGTGEDDRTHFQEILSSHFADKDPQKKTREQLAAVLEENVKLRTAHHHVFSQPLVEEILKFSGFEMLYQQEMPPFHLITIGRKL